MLSVATVTSLFFNFSSQIFASFTAASNRSSITAFMKGFTSLIRSIYASTTVWLESYSQLREVTNFGHKVSHEIKLKNVRFRIEEKFLLLRKVKCKIEGESERRMLKWNNRACTYIVRMILFSRLLTSPLLIFPANSVALNFNREFLIGGTIPGLLIFIRASMGLRITFPKYRNHNKNRSSIVIALSCNER